ncbi:reverse transcriptase domain-containing protein [Tanacetum coccineum]
MQEVILFYNGLGIPTRQILVLRGAIPSKIVADAKERGFGCLPSSIEANSRDQVKSILTTIEADSCPIRRIGSSQYVVSTEQNRTLMYETRKTTIPFPSRLNGASVNVMPLSTYLNLGLGELAHTKLTIELVDRTVKYPKGVAENVLVGIGKFVFPVDFINLDMPEDIKVPLILGRPFLSTARAKIDVYKRKITLRIGEGRIIFKSVKPATSLIKRVYMLNLRERMELDLEARLIGETLVINRSLDPLDRDYIELNNLNEPFELRRNQGDELMPTIEEGKVIEEFKTRDDELDTGIDDYPSYCDYDKKIHIDFLENMDAYCDKGIGDVIFGEPFLSEVGIKARQFKGMITIYNGNECVTYQMVRSHPRFKHHINEQCNKIPPLLKVGDEDKNNGILHPYQKFKGFYKGVLNSGPDYIRDAKTEEWLTCRHIIIMEYLVKLSKRRAFWSLNEDILKITVLTTNTPYPSRKIRRICACTHQRPQRKLDQYVVSSEDPIRHIGDILGEYSGRYQTWSLLQETPNTPYPRPWIRHIDTDSRPYKYKIQKRALSVLNHILDT